MNTPPAERYSARAAIDSLARRFGLRNEHGMQDWEIEAADEADFDALLTYYSIGEASEDECFSLMMILIECADEALMLEESEDRWRAIEPWLRAHFLLHASTVYYWALLDEKIASDREEDWAAVTTRMRAIWVELAPALQPQGAIEPALAPDQ